MTSMLCGAYGAFAAAPCAESECGPRQAGKICMNFTGSEMVRNCQWIDPNTRIFPPGMDGGSGQGGSGNQTGPGQACTINGRQGTWVFKSLSRPLANGINTRGSNTNIGGSSNRPCRRISTNPDVFDCPPPQPAGDVRMLGPATRSGGGTNANAGSKTERISFNGFWNPLVIECSRYRWDDPKKPGKCDCLSKLAGHASGCLIYRESPGIGEQECEIIPQCNN
jgi:hypothetical protein